MELSFSSSAIFNRGKFCFFFFDANQRDLCESSSFPVRARFSDSLIVSVVPCVTWFELRPRLWRSFPPAMDEDPLPQPRWIVTTIDGFYVRRVAVKDSNLELLLATKRFTWFQMEIHEWPILRNWGYGCVWNRYELVFFFFVG